MWNRTLHLSITTLFAHQWRLRFSCGFREERFEILGLIEIEVSVFRAVKRS